MRKLKVKLAAAMGLMVCAAAIGYSGMAFAHGGGGGGGHGGGGGGHFSGGGHFGGGHAGGGFRGGYGGRGRGGYGWRGGYGGYRGGFGWRGGYGGLGWGGFGWGGLGIGLYFASLPYYYATYWDAGVPYYYADDNYFQWDSNVGQYQTVTPPAEVQRQAEQQTSSLIAYPKNGQTDEQQASDKSECRSWAVSQSGFDPTQTITAGATGKHSDFMRADAACLEGRGYSVR